MIGGRNHAGIAGNLGFAGSSVCGVCAHWISFQNRNQFYSDFSGIFANVSESLL